MNKIDRLIKEMCPKGVEYRELGDIVNILDNKRKAVAKDKRKKGQYPYYGANGIQSYVNDYIFDGVFILMGEDGSVTKRDGTPIINWVLGKIWVNNHAHVLQQKNEKFSLRYIYYSLQNINIEHLVKGLPPKLNQENLKSIIVPIPPIEVQKEIVKILDKFTELEVELAAELEARKIQYEYYRNSLISNDIAKKVSISSRYKRLRGTQITASKMKEINEKNGEVRIFAGGKTIIDTNPNNIPIEDIINVPSVLVQSRGIIDFIYYDKPFSFKQEMWSYTSENKITTKYLYYLLKSNVEYFRNIGSIMGSMPQISLNITDNFEIPLPPLDEQARIVAILDKFDKLVNDIKEGLPAEIEMRRKQYEYYRSKLLDFEVLNDE